MSPWVTTPSPVLGTIPSSYSNAQLNGRVVSRVLAIEKPSRWATVGRRRMRATAPAGSTLPRRSAVLRCAPRRRSPAASRAARVSSVSRLQPRALIRGSVRNVMRCGAAVLQPGPAFELESLHPLGDGVRAGAKRPCGLRFRLAVVDHLVHQKCSSLYRGPRIRVDLHPGHPSEILVGVVTPSFSEEPG